MAKTYYLENALLNAVLRVTAWSPPAAVFLALFTATPGPSGGGTEVAGNGYARKAITFAEPVNGSMASDAEVVFDEATGGGWGTIPYFAIFDDVAAGNMLYYGSLTSSRTINVGEQLKFVAGGVTLVES